MGCTVCLKFNFQNRRTYDFVVNRMIFDLFLAFYNDKFTGYFPDAPISKCREWGGAPEQKFFIREH